jgi:WD40 repeat protein
MRRMVLFLLAVLILAIGSPTAADEGQGLQIITVENVEQVEQLRILEDVEAWDVAWSPSGQQLAVGTTEGVMICQCDTFDNPARLEDLEGVNAYRLAWSPDGTLLAVGTAGSPANVILRNMTTGKSVTIDVPADVLSLDFSTNGSMLAAGLEAGKGVMIISTEHGQPIQEFPSAIPVETVAFTSEDDAIIYPPARDQIRLQPLRLQEATDLPTPCTVTQLRIAPTTEHHWIAAASYDCCVGMLDLDSGEVLFRTQCDLAFTLDFNLDGSLLITGNQDGTLHFLQSDGGQDIQMMSVHDGPISRLAMHPDGTRIVTASLDDTIRVFGVRSDE